jgi:2-phospho-L-lactate guanylyltransferase
MKTWALIPVRSVSTGKSRLGGLGAGRCDVARALFQHVHAVVASCPLIDGILVATDDEEVGTIARQLLLDDGRQPLSAIVDRGLEALVARGAAAAIVIMADLPLLAAGDVARMIAALDDADVVAAPDRDHLGTNALALRLPATPTCFGNPDSYPRHVAAARAAGLRLATVDRDGLAFDLDCPADLADLTTEAEARVGGQALVRAEAGIGVVDAIERIRRGLVGEGPAHPV